MKTLSTTGPVVEYPTTPHLTHQLRPVSEILDDFLGEVRPTQEILDDLLGQFRPIDELVREVANDEHL